LALLAICCLVPLSARADEPNKLTTEELEAGWILLFDGETAFGWEAGSDANWQVVEGALVASEGKQGLLATTSEFSDFVLKVEFRATPQTNSGVFLRTPLQPTDPATDCYELNIAAPDVSPFSTGSFVGRDKAPAPAEATDWQAFEVTAQGDHWVVLLNGKQVLDYRDQKPLGRGRIGLQFNQGKIEFRNVKLKPLGLAPLFNGRDLAGWKVFPEKRSEFSVTPEGYLQIKNGNGQIETEQQFADFVLQAAVQTNGRGLNSGIFFRNVPGQFWQGYESQIHNAFRKGDRNDPIDFGTGGIYRRQKARRVVADDRTWLFKTIVANGPHMAVWVNGIQVSDWTDTREPNANPREGLRLEAGTISLQGHDPTTNLWFRDLRAAELNLRGS
jgi:hypothetical protein